MAHSSVQLSTRQEFDYDLADGFFSDGEFASSSRHRKRRALESPLTGLASRFGTRFPSFSRKWRLRKGASCASITADLQQENAISRDASSRSSSISNSARQVLEKAFDPQLPPTPTRSILDTTEETSSAITIDIEKANHDNGEREEGFATTLPSPAINDGRISQYQASLHVQSPLQSPSVAESSGPLFS